MKEIWNSVSLTNLAEIPCVAWRTLTFKVFFFTDTCAAIFAWIRVAHSIYVKDTVGFNSALQAKCTMIFFH